MRFREKRLTVSGYFYILKPQKTLLPKTGKLLSKGMRSSEKSCYMFDCNLACALFGGLHTGKWNSGGGNEKHFLRISTGTRKHSRRNRSGKRFERIRHGNAIVRNMGWCAEHPAWRACYVVRLPYHRQRKRFRLYKGRCRRILCPGGRVWKACLRLLWFDAGAFKRIRDIYNVQEKAYVTPTALYDLAGTEYTITKTDYEGDEMKIYFDLKIADKDPVSRILTVDVQNGRIRFVSCKWTIGQDFIPALFL